MQEENKKRPRQEVTKISKKGGDRLKNLKESFLKEFDEALSIEIDLHYSTHVPAEEMIAIVAEASRKTGIDFHAALKHFQFTHKEIKEHLERSGQSVNYKNIF
jgi:hypothetical protein